MDKKQGKARIFLIKNRADSLLQNHSFSKSLILYKSLIENYKCELDSYTLEKIYINILNCYFEIGICDSAKIYLSRYIETLNINNSFTNDKQISLKILNAKMKFCEGEYKKTTKILLNIINGELFHNISNQQKFDLFRYLAFSYVFLQDTVLSEYYVSLALNHYKYEPIFSVNKRNYLYYDLGNYHMHVGNYNKALYYFNYLKHSILNSMVIDLPLLSALNTNISVCYFRMGDIENAIEIMNKDKISNIKIHNIINIDHLLALGYYYFAKGQYEDAARYFNKSIKENKTETQYENFALMYSYSLIGTLKYLIADYQSALNYYMRTFQLLGNVNKTEYVKLIKTYSYVLLGNVYSQLGNFDKSILSYTQALNCFSDASLSYIDYELICNINLGLVYSKLGNIKKANDFYLKASIDVEKINDKNNTMPFLLTQIYYNYAELASVLGYKYKFEKYLGKAIKYAAKQSTSLNFSLSRLFKKTALKYELNNSLDSALVYYQKAISYSINGFNETDIRKNPSIDIMPFDINLIESLECKADAFSKYYYKISSNLEDLETALETYLVGIDFVDKIMCRFRSEKKKLMFGEKHQSIFNSAFKTAFTLHELTNEGKYLESIFKIVEKNKAAALRQALNESNAKLNAGIPDTLLEKEEELRVKWNKFNNLLYKLENSPQMSDSLEIKYYSAKIFELSQEYDFLIDHLETQYSDYYKLKYNTSTVTLKEIQSKQNDNSAFIEYLLTDSILFIFGVTKDTVSFKQIHLDKNFDNLVSRFRESIHERLFDEFVESSYQLYKILLEPLGFLKSKSNLLIITDDVLGYIPFEALLTKPVKKGGFDYRYLPYFINSYQITYDYSATLHYNHLNRNYGEIIQKLYGFAPIKY